MATPAMDFLRTLDQMRQAFELPSLEDAARAMDRLYALQAAQAHVPVPDAPLSGLVSPGPTRKQ